MHQAGPISVRFFMKCFRCLDRDSGWVSKARLSKNDDSHSWYTLNHAEQASRSLGMDIMVYTEDVIPVKKDKNAQKRLLGAEFWPFLQKALPKYKKKIPMSDTCSHCVSERDDRGRV